MSPPPSSSLAAFRRVFNLRMVAAVYYFCLLHAAARIVSWLGRSDKGWFDGLVEVSRFTRQSLLTGFALLLMAAVAEALLARRPLAPRSTLALQGGAVAIGAVLGTLARYEVAHWSDPALTLELRWLIPTAALWALMGGMAYALLRVMRAEQEAGERFRLLERERAVLTERDAEAQLGALNAQIEPHFLFNTLANVKRLYETQPERGRDMLASLINYLRAALPGMRSAESTLGNELELVKNYLSILQMRMGERLRFEIQSPPELLQQRLPPMVLPTLVENAIKHGLSPLPEGGRIEIQARQDGPGLWSVEVRDDGRGFAPSSSGSGVGLANTRARLAARYGEAAALELEARAPRGVTARVRLPVGAAA